MEPKDFIYNDTKRGTIKYIGSINDDKDHTFDNNYLDNLTSSGKYKEAIDYIDSYSYTSPSYYNQISTIRQQCERNIAYEQHLYEHAGPAQKDALDFIKNYDNDYNNLDLNNSYAKKYQETLDNMFGEDDFDDAADVIELHFSKTKRKFIFDGLARDNTNNNIHAFEQRLGESIGSDGSINREYLRRNGVEISNGDEDGAGIVKLSKNSPFLKNVIESIATDAFIPDIYSLSKSGKRNYEGYSVFNARWDENFLGLAPRVSDLKILNDIIKDARTVEDLVSFNDSFVNHTTNYGLMFDGAEELDKVIAMGGKEGTAAKQMRDLYEKKLLSTLRLTIGGGLDMYVGEGNDDFMNLDDYGIPQLASDEQQRKILNEVNTRPEDLHYGVSIADDGSVGIVFLLEGREKTSENKKAKTPLQFTIWNWNTDDIAELFAANPEYRAIAKVNEISRFQTSYTALDGQTYTHKAGTGGNATFMDNSGRTVDVQELRNIVQRDDMIRRATNGITSLNYSRSGQLLGDGSNAILQAQAEAIRITNSIDKSTPVDIQGRPLDVKELQAFMTLNAEGIETANNFAINDASYDWINLMNQIYGLLTSQLRTYDKQR